MPKPFWWIMQLLKDFHKKAIFLITAPVWNVVNSYKYSVSLLSLMLRGRQILCLSEKEYLPSLV